MKTVIKRYAVIFFGVVLVAFAVSVFYTPNKIVSGGVSGVATVLYHTLGIAPGVSYAVINFVLVVLALKFLGKMFVINTLLGAGLLSVLVQIFSYIPTLTNDVLLSTDILGRLFQKVFPHIRIGSLLLFTDAVVIFSSLVIFKKFDLALYGIGAMCISSFSINWLIRKLNISKLAFVVTDLGYEIAEKLISNSPRGVTIINATGGYTMSGKNVLVCALKESETEKFQKRILSVDSSAFIIFSEASQIVGNGFRVYK